MKDKLFYFPVFLTFAIVGALPELALSAPGDGQAFPYGSWWMMDPQSYQPGIVAGALYICSDKETDRCQKNEVTFGLLEKNLGAGCTDYISTGRIGYDSGARNWKISLQESGDSPPIYVRKSGSKLLMSYDNDSWDFKLMPSDEVDRKIAELCR